ncbi:MAG: hypothetical protein M3220_11660 [Chloroflexota bacterium]|nr:hypothetical protein [Chloroflexota bacterium]
MARRSRGLGLSAYFNHTAFDVDTDVIFEHDSRAYLEHRLAQLDMWLPYLIKRLGDRHRQLGGSSERLMLGGDTVVEAALDLAYLQAIRQALHEALRAL